MTPRQCTDWTLRLAALAQDDKGVGLGLVRNDKLGWSRGLFSMAFVMIRAWLIQNKEQC